MPKKENKTHIKLKDRAVCGIRRGRPRFAETAGAATCLRCRKAVEK